MWAKEQAVRVQVWERRFEDVMSELSEQVERTVDHDVLSDRLVNFVCAMCRLIWSLVQSCLAVFCVCCDLRALALFDLL